MKLKYKILTCLLFISIIRILVLQAQSYTYPKPGEINKRINYLQRVIKEPLTPASAIMTIGRESSEWMLFSYSFATYALTNIAVRDTAYTRQATEVIKEAINKTLDEKISSWFTVDPVLLQSDSIPDYSVLYLGHLNLMMGCYRLLSNDSTFNELNNRLSKSLNERYTRKKFLNLESYPASIWIPDNTVAIASLRLHSRNTGSTYDATCIKWSNYVKATCVDKETGVLYSTLHPQTGEPIEEPRGSMLGWSILFIYQFDSAFAIDLYKNYKKHFSDNYSILRIFRERSDKRETNTGDIDSGPIVFGYSIPANEFALGNALLAQDFKTANKLERLISLGAKQNEEHNEIKYKVRFLKMNISPLAEALVLNSLTIVKWTAD